MQTGNKGAAGNESKKASTNEHTYRSHLSVWIYGSEHDVRSGLTTSVSRESLRPLTYESQVNQTAGSRPLHALVRLFLRYLFEAARREIKNELIFKTIGWVFVPVSGNPYLKITTV